MTVILLLTILKSEIYFSFFEDNSEIWFSCFASSINGAMVDDTDILDSTEKYNVETSVHDDADGANLV